MNETKKSYLFRDQVKGYDICAVGEDCEDITDNQRFIIEHFNSRTSDSRLASRKDLKPEEIIQFLPFVSLMEIKFDENNSLKGLLCRLFGTAMVDFYGEWTGKVITFNDDNDELNLAFPKTYQRLYAMTDMILEKKKPISLYGEHLSDDRAYMQIRNLMIPFAQNGIDIDMIFLYTELTAEDIDAPITSKGD